jgi:hypothetical protein
LQQGKSADDVIKGVRLGNPDWDYYEAGYFVSASAEAYCPEKVSSE